MCTSDLLVAFCWVTVGLVDIYYNKTFAGYSLLWRKGITCKLLNVLLSISLYAGVWNFLLLYTVRYLGIKYPFRRYLQYNTSSVIVSIWLSVIAAVAANMLFLHYAYSSELLLNKFCLFLHLEANSQIMVNVLAWCFVVIVPISICFTCYFTWGMLNTAEVSKQKVQMHDANAEHHAPQVSKLHVFYNIAITAIVPLFGWLPVSILCVITICGMVVDPVITTWVCVCYLPVCSIINPIMHVFWFQLKGNRCHCCKN